MIIACLFGVLGGIIGALPLLVIRRVAAKPGSIVNVQSILFGLLGIACSLVICVVQMLIYRQFDAENFLGFGFTTVLAFLVATTITMIRGMRKQTR